MFFYTRSDVCSHAELTFLVVHGCSPHEKLFSLSVLLEVRGDKSDETFMSVVLRKVLHNDTKKLLWRQSSPVLCAEHTLKVSTWTPLARRFGMITPKPLLHHPTVRRASVTIVTH